MEELDNSNSIEQEKLTKPELMRVFAKRGTPPLSILLPTISESPETPSPKPEQLIRIPDLKLSMHCHIVQNLIIGKTLCTLIFLIGLSNSHLLILLPLLFLEFLGFCGSLNLKKATNCAFIFYLLLSILLRTITSLWAYSILSPTKSCFSDLQACDEHGKYILGSFLFILYESLQIYTSLSLIRKADLISNYKKEEMYFVLTAQVIPRFICCGKLKPWKLVI